MKNLLIKLAKQFKKFPYFGRQRFWILYWAYRITGWHIRHKEWDFVLEYFPKLESWQKVSVLDIGCSRNLFCHEIFSRGYHLTGIDLEIPSFKYPGLFFWGDARDNIYPMRIIVPRDFITCISVFEHIEDNQERALCNMVGALKVGGRLLLTIPTHEFAQGHPWHGFSCQDIVRMLPEHARIRECTERAGQLCMAIERI